LNHEKVIEVENLSKRFKEIKAVSNLNLNVYQGDVFGFLGPNGAGKSTTIRMLLSLITPDDGEIKIFGKSLKANRIEVLKRVGAIVEKPDFYGYLTAYKNLEILAKLSSFKASKCRIMEILELVGLEKRYKSKVKTYSHGMKQRLGIAQALIHEPDLIILDEPTTGLDPQGMKEIRELILKLSKEKNKTIFLSSHILHEVELVANRMIILNKGTTRVEGNVEDLLKASELKVTFRVDNPDKALQLVNANKWGEKLSSKSENKFVFNLSPEEPALLNKFFVQNDIAVNSVMPMRSLEEYFLQLTEKE
jgi:ABC-type multidrug transport system ATPase subunit